MKIETLRQLVNKNQLEPYIRHIRFPRYKNIVPFTKIDFTFPITALVGANGTNKSSLLRALYGAPGNNNLGNYWFSTDIDQITKKEEQFPHCFVYGYLNTYTTEVVEVLKTRVQRKEDPDYWEPSRPILRYKMKAMPAEDPKDTFRSKTRWNAITKTVELIDFRHALSAFDRYFYYGDFSREETFSDKKTRIRARAPHLKNAIENSLNSYLYYGVERIIQSQNTPLSHDEIEAVQRILGRNYKDIQLIGHKFYNNDGFTAHIVNKDFQYTEAFAGSGEFAVIMLVTHIMRAEPRSLILLDEPEVSLHPGAQEQLLDFLSDQVIKHKHQIIFTTHSPTLIRRLPPDAIKVLTLQGDSQVALESQTAMPEEAFIKIGEPIAGCKTIIAEDRLAIEIAKRAIRIHHPQFLELIKFSYYPGGASVLFNSYVPPYTVENRCDVLCLLDGDQAPCTTWPNDEELRVKHDDELDDLIFNLTGNRIKFPINSGNHAEKSEQTATAQRQFLKWCFINVRYLPSKQNPESFVLSKTGQVVDTDAKEKFVQLTRQSLGLTDDEDDPDSTAIFLEQCRYVAKIPEEDEDMAELAKTIKSFLAISAQKT